jgi:predicted nucleic acid-binding Zn ribbon protein
MAKIMSRNSFQLKGGGWYRDLYSSSGRKGDAAGTTSGNSTPASESSGSGGSGTAKEATAPQTSSAPSPAPATSSPKKD